MTGGLQKADASKGKRTCRAPSRGEGASRGACLTELLSPWLRDRAFPEHPKPPLESRSKPAMDAPLLTRTALDPQQRHIAGAIRRLRAECGAGCHYPAFACDRTETRRVPALAVAARQSV